MNRLAIYFSQFFNSRKVSAQKGTKKAPEPMRLRTSLNHPRSFNEQVSLFMMGLFILGLRPPNEQVRKFEEVTVHF